MNLQKLVCALKIVKPAISNKEFDPSLKCFRFDGKVVYGYNGEVYIETLLDTDFTCAIPADPFMKFLNSISDSEVDIQVEKNAIHVKTPHTYIIFPMSETPSIEVDKTESGDVYILTQELFEGIEICTKFMSKDETQPQYRGIYIDKEFIYATDGFRLARYRADSDFSFFIPDAFCSLLLMMKPKKIHLHKNHLKCITRDTLAYSTVLSEEHKIPDYISIFDKIAVSPAGGMFKLGAIGNLFDRTDIFTSGLVDKTGKLLLVQDQGIQLYVENPLLGICNVVIPVEGKVMKSYDTLIDIPLFRTVIENSSHIEIVNEEVSYPIIRGVKGNFEVLLTTLS